MASMAGDSAFSTLSWFSSELTAPRERYLARLLTQTLAENWRSPEDFLRHFTPRKLMRALAGEDTLRAAILIGAAGVHAKLAKKKPPESAAEDLELALEEGVTDAAQILELLPIDDQVRLLDARELWAFANEDGFWTSTPGKPEHKRAAARIAFLLESALHEELISLQDVVQGVGFAEIASSLPPARLQDVVRHALELGHAGRPLDEMALLEVAPLSDLLEFVPLEHVWQTIIAERIAKPLDFGEPVVSQLASTAAPLPNLEEDPDLDTAFAQLQSTPPASPAPESKATPSPKSAAPSPPPLPVRPPAKAAREPSERPPLEDEARQRVYTRLSRMDRLPPSHESLPLPVLLSIESMYSELLTFSDDEAREQCIRDSFPNEQHLRTAMLALIDLLDPSIETKRSTIKDTDIDSLIAVVLFEERQRQEHKAAARSAARAEQRATATPVSGARTPSSVPPPSGARSLRALTPPAPLVQKR